MFLPIFFSCGVGWFISIEGIKFFVFATKGVNQDEQFSLYCHSAFHFYLGAIKDSIIKGFERWVVFDGGECREVQGPSDERISFFGDSTLALDGGSALNFDYIISGERNHLGFVFEQCKTVGFSQDGSGSNDADSLDSTNQCYFLLDLGIGFNGFFDGLLHLANLFLQELQQFLGARLSALVILTEIGLDFKRFGKFDRLCAYCGLMPDTDSSGEQERVGDISSRGNRRLRRILIECAWAAVKRDPELALAYCAFKKRMAGQKAIVKIARKLLNRIRRVLIKKEKYTLSQAQ